MRVPMVKTRINGRWDIILPKHRADRPEWNIENGGWEKARLDSMLENIKKDDVVFYVGAEEGDMCGLIAKWGANLVMFEPNEKVMPNMKAIWEANNLADPLFFAGFASDNTTEGWEKGIYGLDDITGEVIPDHGFKELRDPDTMPQVKIDDFIKTIPIIPNVISMDVEGSEGKVLRGAEETIRKYKPILYISMHPEFLITQYNEWTAELRGWIKDLDYDEVLLDYQHECHFLYTPRES